MHAEEASARLEKRQKNRLISQQDNELQTYLESTINHHPFKRPTQLLSVI